jgi:hypothetical protein
MYYNLNYYIIQFIFSNLLSINSKMLKSGMVVLTERENADIADVNVVVG